MTYNTNDTKSLKTKGKSLSTTAQEANETPFVSWLHPSAANPIIHQTKKCSIRLPPNSRVEADNDSLHVGTLKYARLDDDLLCCVKKDVGLLTFNVGSLYIPPLRHTIALPVYTIPSVVRPGSGQRCLASCSERTEARRAV